MPSYKILLLTILLGILSLFFPFVTYPVRKLSLYGWMGDGFIVLFVFLLIIGCSVLSKSFPKLSWLSLIGVGLSIFNLYVVYTKYTSFIEDKANFHVEDIRIAPQVAGYYLDYGFYSYAVFSTLLVIAMVVFSAQLLKIKKSAAIVLMIGLVSASLLSCDNINPKTDSEVIASAEKAYLDLTKAVKTRNYDVFIEMMHPISVESFGGKKMMKQFLEDSYMSMDSSGYILQEISLDSIQLIKNDSQPMIKIWQTNRYKTSDSIFIAQDILLGVTNVNRDWKFVNINNKNEDQIKIYKI